MRMFTIWRMSKGHWWGRCILLMTCRIRLRRPHSKLRMSCPWMWRLGKLDYMEIVGFSDHKSTAAVWYKLLNLGFKVPAGAGTDATANYAAPIRGQVGQDRVYVLAPGWPANPASFMDGLRQGRTFATNGPLLEFKLGGANVGSELKFDTAQEGGSVLGEDAFRWCRLIILNWCATGKWRRN